MRNQRNKNIGNKTGEFLDNFMRWALSSKALKHLFWKNTYTLLSRIMKQEPMAFLNYGYLPDSFNEPINATRTSQLLYETVADKNIKNKTVLEVGCGRGGGATHLARVFEPRQYIGLDFSSTSIAYARRHSQQQNLTFVEGNALALPFADNTFDGVINVESSHCYPERWRFFAEVLRVLKPGGTFYFADLCMQRDLPELKEGLFDGKCSDRWHIEIDDEITTGVLRALNSTENDKGKILSSPKLRFFSPLLSYFWAQPGTAIYNKLTTGELKYVRYRLIKK